MSTIRDHSSSFLLHLCPPLPTRVLFYSPSALQRLVPSLLPSFPFLLIYVCDALAASHWFSCCRVSRWLRPRRRERRVVFANELRGLRKSERLCWFGFSIVPGVSPECLGNDCKKVLFQNWGWRLVDRGLSSLDRSPRKPKPPLIGSDSCLQ